MAADRARNAVVALEERTEAEIDRQAERQRHAAGIIRMDEDIIPMQQEDSIYKYFYDAQALGVVDGDTLDVEIDLGLDVRHRIRLRLYGLNAPELHTHDLERSVTDFLSE